MVSSHHLLVFLSTKDVLLIFSFFLFTALAALAALKISKRGKEEDSKMEEAIPGYMLWGRLKGTALAESKLKASWGAKEEVEQRDTLAGWGLRWRPRPVYNRVNYPNPHAEKRVKDVPAGKRVVPDWKAGRYAIASRHRGASDGPFQTRSNNNKSNSD
jgi:hypothetical protein